MSSASNNFHDHGPNSDRNGLVDRNENVADCENQQQAGEVNEDLGNGEHQQQAGGVDVDEGGYHQQAGGINVDDDENQQRAGRNENIHHDEYQQAGGHNKNLDNGDQQHNSSIDNNYDYRGTNIRNVRPAGRFVSRLNSRQQFSRYVVLACQISTIRRMQQSMYNMRRTHDLFRDYLDTVHGSVRDQRPQVEEEIQDDPSEENGNQIDE